MRTTINHRQRARFSRVTGMLIITVVGLAWLLSQGTADGKGERDVRLPLPSAEQIAALPADGGAEFNRLIFEQSPYLLQHARNPVDWYPWGEAAFARARELDRPVFLSVGYATCHWCHVMEHESFEDDEVAALMNDAFICIKVDREERPDIDNVYMTVTQAMTGRGGWPMTVVLTPDKEPFFAGTYYPKQGRYGRPGMMQLIPALKQAWSEKRDELMKQADLLGQALARQSSGNPGPALGEAVLASTYQQLAASFDAEHGGFGQAPKFPVPHNFRFLLRYGRRHQDSQAVEMVVKTLTEMRLGGIYDQVGFGFHRYSTDRVWLVPHFEKMLYDQALLTMAYVEAFQVTGAPLFEQTAREILTYVQRDMTAPEGGFYSAEDADSEGEEGLFYLWTPEEVKAVLGGEEGQLFCELMDIRSGGNFAEEASGDCTGSSIPHLTAPLAELAALHQTTVAALQQRLTAAREKLFSVREKRIHPLKDDKVLTDWNGLMIAALARTGQAFGDDGYTAAAKRAADFVLAKLQTPEGRLLKRYRGGAAGLPAHLDDYAFFVWGLIELYEATAENQYLAAAVRLNETMLRHFWDVDRGGLFLTADDSEALLVRSKEVYDGAIPAGNSVAALNLVRLAAMTGETALAARADELIRAFSGDVSARGMGHTQLLLAVDWLVGPANEVVIVEGRQLEAMLTALRRPFLPNKAMLLKPGVGAPALSSVAAFTAAMAAVEGQATAFVCENFACQLPTADCTRMLELLGAARDAAP